MKPFSLPFSLVLLTGMIPVGNALATGQSRALYRNNSSEQPATQAVNPGVALFDGYIKGSQAQTGSGVPVLEECAFGQPFSQYYPSATYSQEITSSVRDALYPAANVTTRAAIIGTVANPGKPFRYKLLMYEGSGTDVTAYDPASIASWYTPADRALILQQIAVLKTAAAASPLDTGIRALLLDVYYDLAVAEMQAAKPKLATLAKLHLGLEVIPAGKFIIDREIDTYQEIDSAFQQAIDEYAELLSAPFPDIDPSSFDPALTPGLPMGQYIFRQEQKFRSTMAATYANAAGIQEVPAPGPNNTAVARTPGTALFNGYKDLNALLDLMGQRQRHLATLVRLLGIRKGDGDVAFARQAIARATAAGNNDLLLIRSWFPEIFPPDLSAITPARLTAVKILQQESGIFSALSAIEAGRIDLLATLPFLNGSVNSLGYDPDFLLLLQDSSSAGNTVPRETYDILRDMLKGPNKPLTAALTKLGTESPQTGAVGKYLNFQEKVDRVAADIDEEDDALDARHFAITGFDVAEVPGFDAQALNARPGSELAQVLLDITALNDRQTERKGLQANFDDLLADGTDGAKAGFAQQAVGLAEGRELMLQGAVARYKLTTSGLYDQTTAAKVTSAVSQAAFDATSGASGASNPIGAVATGVVGAVNTAVQGASAFIIANNEKNIDFAGIEFSAATEGSDIAMAVNQTRLDLAALKREQSANTLDTKADTAAMAQASARQAGLLAELARIVRKRDENVSEVRKKSYASPLHYHRSEAALIAADDAFHVARRWMFYTLQALNYKWHGHFSAVTASGKRYDSSTLFKCSNAGELDDLLTEMETWNSDRVSQTSSSPVIFTKISLRDHILARNPKRYDPVNPADPGLRADNTATPAPAVLTPISTELYFQRLLERKFRIAGELVIPFSTAFGNQIVDRVDGNFFRGASYNASGAVTDPGFWREKILYVKVNIIAADAPAVSRNYSGSLTYGGMTYFHTRVPPRSDRSIAGLAADDAPGELLIAPFRRWESPDFSQNFTAKTEHTPSIPIAYSRTSAVIQGPGGVQDNLGANFQVNAFSGRSIAASGWRLSIPLINNGGSVISPSDISDVELLIAYKHSDRVSPP